MQSPDNNVAIEASARADVAIEAIADALLAVCALQTGTDPLKAFDRAARALLVVMDRAKREQGG